MKVRNVKQLFLAYVERSTCIVSKMKGLLDTRGIFIMLLLALVIVQSQAFCDTAAATSSLDSLTTKVVETIFSPWVRRTALAFGAGMGIFQAVSSGSFIPLLTWGGMGLAVNYLPKVIELVGSF